MVRFGNAQPGSQARNRIIYGLAAEVAFTILPLVVVLIVVSATQWSRLFASPEWSFGAAILFGQSLVRFSTGLLRGAAAAGGPVALTVALVIVFGLVPSLIVLSLTLQSAEIYSPHTGFSLEQWLHAAQVVLFGLAALTYLTLGTIGEVYAQRFSSSSRGAAV